MIIITHGNTYHEIECPKCKAQFGYVDKDKIIEDHQSPFGDKWFTTIKVKCPECNNYILLSHY